MNKNGIAVAGNMVFDILYRVQGLPKPGELTSILEGFSRTCGGAVCNVATDLAKLDDSVPITALGRLGTDAEGDFILSMLRNHKNIDISNIKREGITSFTPVMADEITKQRTFFHYRGANAFFSEDDINWDNIKADLLHIGYILLLDALDAEDGEFGTKIARLLFHARERGIKTSVDVVSENGTRFMSHVPPALKYTDYCIINEFEAEKTTGVILRDEKNNLLYSNIKIALEKLKTFGVSTWAVIHSPEGGFGLDSTGKYEEDPTFDLPENYIKGTVGAGDAFCAGVLYGAYTGFCLRESLVMGNAAAVCSLSQPGATEGMRSAKDAMALYRKLYKTTDSLK
ncbi:MAG: carbohydrate kinase family protein [Treponema sp.]|jgi:sugar/nucleoside kinase (ribokinase family)|nr:carbohydrate kinase family protein [Treponema sp.]